MARKKVVEIEICPKCKKPFINRMQESPLFVVHRVESRQVKSAASGKLIDCKSVVEWCDIEGSHKK